MIRGIYSAAAGMIAESTRNDVTANNMANAATVGFKKDIAVTKDFHSVLLKRINDGEDKPAIGSLGGGSMIDEVVTVHTGGAMRTSDNPLDLAIAGEGFFAVQTPAGVRYTRNGCFTRNAQGDLVTQSGYQVLGEGGPITMADAKRVTVAEDGRVMIRQDITGGAAEVEAGRIKVVSFANPKQLVKEGETLFRADGMAEQPADNAIVRSGMLEQSNVNVISEMVNLIAGYRAYEVNSKSVQAHDQLLDKAVNSVGAV